jgi:hypothetical protein
MSVYKLLPQGYVCVQAPAGQVDRQSSGAACLPSVLAPASSAVRAMMAMSKQQNRQSVKQYGTYRTGQECRKARIFLSRRKRCHEGITAKTSSAVLAMQEGSKPVLRIRIHIDFSPLDPDLGRHFMFLKCWLFSFGSCRLLLSR